MLRAARLSGWVNQFVPALTARRKVVKVDGHVGDVVREGFQIELNGYGKSADRAGCLASTCSWRCPICDPISACRCCKSCYGVLFSRMSEYSDKRTTHPAHLNRFAVDEDFAIGSRAKTDIQSPHILLDLL